MVRSCFAGDREDFRPGLPEDFCVAVLLVGGGNTDTDRNLAIFFAKHFGTFSLEREVTVFFRKTIHFMGYGIPVSMYLGEVFLKFYGIKGIAWGS